MNNWFKCKVRYDKTQESGVVKTTTEEYLVDALSFTEAEACIIVYVDAFVSGDFTVVDISRYSLSEMFLDDKADLYYRCKLEFITLDEKSGKEKKQPVYWLVQGNNIEDARGVIVREMGKTMTDYSISKIEETKLLDVVRPNP